MSRDLKMRGTDGKWYSFDNICTGGFMTGKMSGIDIAVGLLEKKATELFQRDRFDEARAMKELAREVRGLEEGLRREAKKYREEHPYEVDPPENLADKFPF